MSRDPHRPFAAFDRYELVPGLDSRLRWQLLWMIGARLLLSTSVVVTILLIDVLSPSTEIDRPAVIRIASASYLASLLYTILHRWSPIDQVRQAYLQFVGDALLVSLLVGQTGGHTSPFSTLYLVVITVATTLLRRRAGIHLASACWVAYAVVSLGTLSDWSLATMVLPHPVLERLIYVLVVHFLGFFAVALMTSYLARDVTAMERELAATSQDLAQLESLHRDVVESISSGLITANLEGTIHQINRAACDILGTRSEEAVGRPIAETGMFTPEEWLRQTGSIDHQKIRREIELDAAHQRRWIGYTLAELRDRADLLRGYTVVFQDFTRWRQVQEELRVKDRMAAVGQMAAGLAHEIGNPLAAISGVVQMMASWPEINPTQRTMLRITQRESERLDRILKDFLAFARPAPQRRVRFDLHRHLAEHLELLRRSDEVRSSHSVELSLGENEGLVEGDPDQIAQIVWNLSRNALRAMPSGGTLTLGANVETTHYAIRVADNGKGMTAEERGKLFQPFHSFFDRGTGIGMAIVYRLVTEQGGALGVETSLGRGTTITVTFPNFVSNDPSPSDLQETPP